MASSPLPAEVAAAIAAAGDPRTPPQQRSVATEYVNRARQAPAAAKAALGAALVPHADVAVRLFGFGLLGDVVRFQWAALDASAQQQLGALGLDTLRGAAAPQGAQSERAVRTKACVLAAELHRVQPPAPRRELLGAALQLAQPGCAPQAFEAVCLFMQAVSDDATVHVDDLDSEERRQLLSDVTGSLGDILGMLYRALEASFLAAVRCAQAGEPAAPHAAALSAALGAVAAFAQWAPLSALAQARVTEACAGLLGVEEMRPEALACLRLLLERKRGKEVDAPAYDHMAGVALAELCKSADGLTLRPNDEYSQAVCDALAASATNMANLPAEWQDGLLTRMLRFYDSPSAHQSMAAAQFWATAMREGAHAARQPAMLAQLLALCARRAVRFTREQGPDDAFPEEFDSAGEYHDFFSAYRHKVMELARALTGLSPTLAAQALSEQMRIAAVAGARAEATLQAGGTAPGALAELEGLAVFAGAVASVYEKIDPTRVSAAEVEVISQTVTALCGQCKWSTKPAMGRLAHLLEMLAPLYGHVSKALPAVLSCLFEALTRAPQSRLATASSLYKLVRRVPRAFLAHRQALMAATDGVRASLSFREWGFLATAALTIACHESQDTAQAVVRWIMQPFQQDPRLQRWISQDVQTLEGFMRAAFACQQQGQGGVWAQPPDQAVLHEAMEVRRVVFHTIEVIHRLHRSLNTAGACVDKAPLKREGDWLLAPLIATLRHLHSVWAVRAQLSEPLQSALEMSGLEVAVMLGGGRGVVLEQKASAIEAGEYHDIDGVSSACLRNWMNGLRDNAYGFLALCFDSITASQELTGMLIAAIADPAILAVMDGKHVRMLIRHVLQPLVRYECADSTRAVLGQIFRALLPHMHARLIKGWAALSDGELAGGALLPPSQATTAGPPGGKCNAAENDVVQDRMMRELTREYAGLLSSLVAKPASFYLDAVLAEGADAAQAVALFPAACLCFPDGESSHRVCALALELVARAAGDSRFHQVVGADLLRAAVQALALETNANHFTEVLTIIQRILVTLAPQVPAARQTMLSFIPQEALAALEETFRRKGGGSEKTRNAAIKKELQNQSGGALKAMAGAGRATPLTNLPTPSARARPSGHPLAVAAAKAAADADEATAPKLDFS